MRILIHAVNSSLFPDANPDSIASTGPRPEIVTVQSLLYASLAISLFAAFLAMLGKQWVNRYLRNRGGSAVDKSRDRQRKLDGFEKWRFHLVIECLPVMLQLALLLLGCGLSRYLWTINRTVAGVIVAVTLLGVTSHVFLTLASTFYYDCPYQTPPSLLTRSLVTYLTRSDATFARSLRSLLSPFLSTKILRRIPQRLRSGVRGVLKSFRRTSAVVEEAERIPLAVVVTSPTRIYEDISINWEVCKADVRCVCWVLDSTTDIDIILSTVRFAADMTWYPEIAGALSPHILADLFFDCLVDGQVIPGKSEHASSIGMALASVLSIHLSVEPGDQALRELCKRIDNCIAWVPSSDPTFLLVAAVLGFIANATTHARCGTPIDWDLDGNIPDHLSTVHKLWLSRVILQTIWRCRRVEGPDRIFDLIAMEPICQRFTADNDKTFTILRTNCFLIMAISLGLQVDIRDLYAPNNKYVVSRYLP